MKRTTKKAAAIAALGSAGVLGLALAMPTLADAGAPKSVAVSAVTDDASSTAGPGAGTDTDTDTDTALHGPGGHGHHGRGPGLGLDVAAETLGLSTDELMAALQDGSTLGEVADAHGVDRQVLVDALLAEQEQRITEMLDRSLPQHPNAPGWNEDGPPDDSTSTQEESTTTESS